jgi:hypothetical protein
MRFSRDLSNKVSENDRRIISTSVVAVILLATLLELSNDQTYSLVFMFFLIIVVIGNLVYFFGRIRASRIEKVGMGI